MKTTTSFDASVKTIAAAGIVCGLLAGCARDHSKVAVYQPIQTAPAAPATQVIGASTNSPVSYQWYKNTNGNEAQFTVQVSSNGPLYYQWYFNTNTIEGAHH